MSASKKEQALQLAKNASIEILDGTRPIREILETCKNVCKLAGISEANSWLDLEIGGYLVRYKTRDDLCQNLPAYRKTAWKFYDLYGNPINLPAGMVDLFGRSTVYHPVGDLESKSRITVEGKLLDKFNKFMSEHGVDQLSKSLQIHEARIPKDEVAQVLEGIKKRAQELLDMIITLLEAQ